MPRQSRDKRWNPSSIYGRRANIDIGGFLGGIGAEGDAAANPAFQNPGQVDYNYAGMPEDSSQFKEPLVGKQSLLQKLRGQPSLGQQLNAKYLTDMAQLQGVNAIDLKNAPVVNPNYDPRFMFKTPQQVPYSQADFDSGIDYKPFSGSSLGSSKENAAVLSHVAQQQADAQAAGDREKNILEAQGGKAGYTAPQLAYDTAFQTGMGNRGYSQDFAPTYSSLAESSAPLEQQNKNLGLSLDIRNKNIVQGIPDTQYNPAYSNNVISSLVNQGLVNKNLQRINVPTGDTVYDTGNNMKYEGSRVMQKETPQFMPNPVKGQPPIRMWGHDVKEYNMTPSTMQPLSQILDLSGADFNTNAPTNKDAIQPTFSAPQLNSTLNTTPVGPDSNLNLRLQSPSNQLDLNDPPAVALMKKLGLWGQPGMIQSELERLKKAFKENQSNQ